MKTVRAKGDFASVGEAVGEATRNDVLFVREAVVPYLAKATTRPDRDSLLAAAAPFFKASERFFPPAFDYLRGLARGAGVAFEDLLLVMFDEEIFQAYGRKSEKCSTAVIRTERGWVIGHNEDYDPHYRGRLAALDLEFTGWPRLLAISYPGKLPGVSGTLNEAGVTVTNNSLSAGTTEGISSELRGFRAALSRGLDEAVEALVAQPSSLPVHFYAISAREDRGVSVEVGNAESASAPSVMTELSGAPDAHTNTVLRLPLTVPDGCSENSRQRYAKLKGLIADGRLPTDHEGLMRLFSERDRLLNRAPEDHPISVTLATVVIRPSTSEIWVHEEGTADAGVYRLSL